MFVGVRPATSRLDDYKAKIRLYGGTGSAPDYTAPVVQQKLNVMYRGMQQGFGG